MTQKVDMKQDALPDLDDLLQCPVCYEIPSGQIFQCNEGHHVCGTCKTRLDVCPVCRALFFGTRNYAMEELIANVKRLKAFKLAGKVTTGFSGEVTPPSVLQQCNSQSEVETPAENDVNTETFSTGTVARAPTACKGIFRCLCCKPDQTQRLPSARMLNHLRYFHGSALIESKSENGEYTQAWHIAIVVGRLVTAIRVADMGLFFFVVEINNNSIYAWLSMVATPWVASEFSYTLTISGNDREAIFSDSVWSVKACEGALKKRGHCMSVTDMNARALISQEFISGKLSVRRTPPEQFIAQSQPRAVLRVADRSHDRLLQPFLQDLQDDVERISLAFASLESEAQALARTERDRRNTVPADRDRDEEAPVTPAIDPPPLAHNSQVNDSDGTRSMSRSARRRMRARLRAALNETHVAAERVEPDRAPDAPSAFIHPAIRQTANSNVQDRQSDHANNNSLITAPNLLHPISGPSSENHNNNPVRTSKKKRRHRR